MPKKKKPKKKKSKPRPPTKLKATPISKGG
jgi:hypothetical protein